MSRSWGQISRRGVLTATALAGFWLATGGLATLSAEESAEALLKRSIEYHDPEARWVGAVLTLDIAESRPDGSSRTTRVLIDGPGGRFGYSSERDGREIEASVEGSTCELWVDGAQPSAADADEMGYSCERLQRIRNYYAYLWGLPMKLLDPGTRLDPEVRDDTFEGRPVKTLRVTYEEAVGNDIWYFHLDPETAALVGYRFYHDESANDGEYIVLEGELEGAGMRLPKSRTWYTHAADELLGTDSLSNLGVADSSP